MIQSVVEVCRAMWCAGWVGKGGWRGAAAIAVFSIIILFAAWSGFGYVMSWHFHHGVRLMEQGKYELAEKSFLKQKAVGYSFREETEWNLAMIYYATERTGPAAEELESVLGMNPDNEQALELLKNIRSEEAFLRERE